MCRYITEKDRFHRLPFLVYSKFFIASSICEFSGKAGKTARFQHNKKSSYISVTA